MKDFHTPEQRQHLIDANSDASMGGVTRVPGEAYEPTSAEELQIARGSGQVVRIDAYGVAIVNQEPQTAAE